MKGLLFDPRPPNPTVVHNTMKVDTANYPYTKKALAIISIRCDLLDGELTEKSAAGFCIISLN